MREVAQPLVDMVATTPYSAIASVHQDPTDPLPVWDGAALLREFPEAAVDALVATAGPDVDIPLILAEVRYLGGALARQPEVPNAVGGRDAAFSVYVVGPYPPALHGIVDAAGRQCWPRWHRGRPATRRSTSRRMRRRRRTSGGPGPRR